jgi:CRISPR-associated endonuclease Cas2
MRKITKIKTKYYSKKILKYLFLAGEIYTASAFPRDFPDNLKRSIAKFKKERFVNSFNYLKRRGLIEIKREGHDIRIALTGEGEKRARKYQIDDLEILRPKKWDRKWRVVIFDIPHLQKTERNAFRSKLKELGFYQLQKSVWAHAFNCREEIKLLREFFGLNQKQIQVLLVEKIENDYFLKKYFDL